MSRTEHLHLELGLLNGLGEKWHYFLCGASRCLLLSLLREKWEGIPKQLSLILRSFKCALILLRQFYEGFQLFGRLMQDDRLNMQKPSILWISCFWVRPVGIHDLHLLLMHSFVGLHSHTLFSKYTGCHSLRPTITEVGEVIENAINSSLKSSERTCFLIISHVDEVLEDFAVSVDLWVVSLDYQESYDSKPIVLV